MYTPDDTPPGTPESRAFVASLCKTRYVPDYSHVRSGGILSYFELSSDEQRLIDATILCRLHHALLDEGRGEFDTIARSDLAAMTGVMKEEVCALRTQYAEDLQRRTPLLTHDWLEHKDSLLIRASTLCASRIHCCPQSHSRIGLLMQQLDALPPGENRAHATIKR